MSIGLTDATAIPVTDETVRTVMSLCEFTDEDDLLRKIYVHVLRTSVRTRANGRSVVKPVNLMLGMTCKRLHALFSTSEIKQHVLPQMRSIRHDFWRRVAVAAANAVGTMPLPEIKLTARLHMNDLWLRVVTTVDDDEWGKMLSLVVTAGNTKNRVGQELQVRIDISRASTLASTPAADREQFLANECLVALQEIFERILRRRGQLYPYEHCLFSM